MSMRQLSAGTTSQVARRLAHSVPTLPTTVDALTCIIHVVEGAKSLLCYKHVVKTVFEATKEASA
jgi:hypothetical protein